ncbi:MAG: class I SAM-dependent methyltransferase [Lachnospiraceae bacterium]
MEELIKHYNKFNEDKRLTRRHGQVEYITTMKYIHAYLNEMKDPKILDIGAGTGRYSIPLSEEGYDVTAVELVKYNLGILKSKKSNVKAIQGNALKLSKLKSNAYDMTFLFGPMYHLYTLEDKVKALKEAERVTKPGGIILVAYLMNEYGVITYGFKEGNALECKKDNRLDENFSCIGSPKDLYEYVRIEEIDEIISKTNVERIQIIAADGPANYMRDTLRNMSDDMFQLFIEYHLSTCERQDLIGASAHTVDILRKRVESNDS